MGKTLLAAVVSATAAAVLVGALPAISAPSATVPRRVAALESKVRVLQTKVTKLNRAVTYDEACTVTTVATSQYSGYLYTPDHGVTTQETTAIDATVQGQTPQVYLQTVSPSCITSSRKAVALSGPARKASPTQRSAEELRMFLKKYKP